MCAGGGDAALDLHERAVELARAARGGDASAADALADEIAGLDAAALEGLVRSLTRWFQLINLVEDNERVRRLNARLTERGPEHQAGSLRDTLRRLAEHGTSAADLEAMLAGAELSLVLTAHPTEARRRTTIDKLARVFAILRDLDARTPLPGDEAEARDQLAAIVQELWGSDEVRAVSPTVLDEVRSGLAYFLTTLRGSVPAFYRELERSVADAYPGEDVTVPPLLSFGSWMGGDRDGNPFVTPVMTEDALNLMRDSCLALLRGDVDRLASQLSLSARINGTPHELDPLLAAGTEDYPELADDLARRNPEEPYRRALGFVGRRLGDGGYPTPAALLEDLHTIEAALVRNGAAFVAGAELRDLIRVVEVFGFHFGRLDVRENAKVHRDALTEIFAAVDVCDAYDGQLDLLVELIEDPRPLIPSDLSGFSASTQEAVELFRTLKRLLDGPHRGAVRSYIISNSRSAADLLEVRLLMKEAGLEGVRIVPLFEAGETLEAAASTMAAALDTGLFEGEQEVMIGYSDSNKDVGYVASGWATYRAQAELATLFRERGVRWTFFHGRGGAVGRGGGRANVAINSQPPGSVAGRLKMTEQGEVLSAKYSVAEIAGRELELTASAALSSTLELLRRPEPDRLEAFVAVMGEMARASADAYRDLVHGDDGFVDFFKAVTPLDEITRLQLGSRPAKRSSAAGIDDLRAIPWVFSWTQARIVLPAWYGLGTALTGQPVELLREMRRDWPFFGALLSNAEMACAKADLGIGARYVELCADDAVRERIWPLIEAEFARTVDALTTIGEHDRLLDGEPVLRDSIDRRNPYVDPLSYVQIELLRRARAGDEDGAPAALRSLCVNGIASGLRNTG